jgi:uncharacterized membrane protein
MKYKGLIEDAELFQCTYLLVFGISALMGGLFSLLFIAMGIRYSAFVTLMLFVIGIASMFKFKETYDEIKLREKEFEAHEQKENLERED